MNFSLRRLKGRLAGAGDRLGKGVEKLLRERVGVEARGERAAGAAPAATAAALEVAHGGDEASCHDAQQRLVGEWQTYVSVATARTGEDARLKQLAVVLGAFEALCSAQRGDAMDCCSVGRRLQLGTIFGPDNSFCAELATIACAEMEKLEWQLEDSGADDFEDAVSESAAQHTAQSAPALRYPSLLQLVHVLASVHWQSKDLAGFESAGLLEVLISALSDRVHVDGGLASSWGVSSGMSGEGDSHRSPRGSLAASVSFDWEPSELDEAMWVLTGRLLLHGALVRELVSVERGKEAMALLFDIASLDARSGRQRWSQGQALASLKLLLDYGDSAASMASYLQAYGCIGKVLQRLAKTYALTWCVSECVRLLEVVVGFVHALAPFSSTFISNFELGEGCNILRQIIARIQKEAADSGEQGGERHGRCSISATESQCLESAVSCLAKLVFFNDEPARCIDGSEAEDAKGGSATPQRTGSATPQRTGSATPQRTQRKLGSVLALDTLVLVFEEAVMHEARKAVLQALASIYAGHPANYRLLCSDALENAGLARLLRSVALYDKGCVELMLLTVRQISQHGHRPLRELRPLATVLSTEAPLDTMILLCKTVYEMVAQDASYRDVFREVSISQALLCSVLDRYARCDVPVSPGVLRWDNAPEMRLDPFMLELLQSLCRGNRANSHQVRLGGLPCFLQLVWRSQDLYAAVLMLLCQITASGDPDDVEACVAGMCEVLHSHHGTSDLRQEGVEMWFPKEGCATNFQTRLVCDMLVALASMIVCETGMAAFRLYGGFEIVLKMLEHHRRGNADASAAMLVARALSLLSVSTSDSPENHHHLWHNVGTDALHQIITDTGILRSAHAPLVLESLLGMACGRAMCLLNIAADASLSAWMNVENDGIKATAWKAEALVLLVSLCNSMSVPDAARMLNVVSSIAAARPDNAQELATHGVIRVLLELLVRGPDAAAVREGIVEIIVTVGSVHLDPIDGRRLLKLCWDPASPWRALLLSALLPIALNSQVSSSYIRFSMEVHGYASAEVHVEKEIAWPPSAGYSIAFWMCVEKAGKGALHLMHLYAQAGNSKESHKTSILLNKCAEGQLSIEIGDTHEMCFSSVTFHPNIWYHVVLVHVQNKLQKSQVSLFVNGQLRQEGKLKMGRITSVLNLIAAPISQLTIFLGLPNNVQPETPSDMQWKMRGAVVVEEPLSAETIFAICYRGYSYDGCYQCEPYEGDIGAAVAMAWRYAAVDSHDFEDSPAEVSRTAAKISWDKLVFASRFLDRRQCRQLIVGKFSGTLQPQHSVENALYRERTARGGVHNLKQITWVGKLGWLRGDSTVVEALSFGDSLRSIGGVAVVLAIIETCTKSSDLVTLLKILRGVLWRNALNLVDMAQIKGYQVVASFLQRRADLITGEVVDELMHIAGFGQSWKNCLLANAEACEHLILDLRTWRSIDGDSAAKFFQGLQELLAGDTRRVLNASVLESIGLVPFLCFYSYQPHVDEATCAHIVGTLERFFAVTVRVQHLNMVAQLMLTGKSSANGQVLELSPDPRAPPNTRFTERPWLKIQLVSMLLRLVKAAGAQTLAVFCASLEPMWFALMSQRIQELDPIVSLLEILTVLIGQNEAYCMAFRRTNHLMLIGSRLEAFHSSPSVYFALFRLMFAAHLDHKISWRGQPYSADKLRSSLAINEDSSVTVPKVLPVILQLLKLSVKSEVAARTDGGPDATLPEASAASETNCVTVQGLRQLYDTIKAFRTLSVSDEFVETLVTLIFLVNDDACAEDETSPTGAVSKMTGAVIKGLGTLLRIRGADNHEEDKSVGFGFMTKLQGPTAKVVAASAALIQRTASPRRNNDAAEHVVEDDGWEDLGEEDGCEDGLSENGAGVSGIEADVEHVAMVPPVPSAAEDGTLDFHSRAGELIFQMLCRILETGVCTPSLGCAIVNTLLESIPLAVPGDDQRLFGGVILSKVCKLLYKNNRHIDVGNGELVKQLVMFAEMMTDFVCADCFTLNYRELMEFITFLMLHLQAANTTGYAQDSAHMSKHLGALHKTTNRVLLHLLSHLQQAPDRLSTFVQALGEHGSLIFGWHNNDSPMILLIAHNLFGFFSSDDIVVRHSAMRVWGHLLENKRAVLMPLLAYQDLDSSWKSLFSDGFSRLVISGAKLRADEHDAAVAVAICEFDEWLTGAAGGKVSTAVGTRWARVSALVHDNATKQRVKVLSGEQLYHAEVQKRHYKNRVSRLQNRRKRLVEEKDTRITMQCAAENAERKAISQWRLLVRGHWQNLESRSVYTRQQWARDKQAILRERGVLGQQWEELEDCAWRTHRLPGVDMEDVWSPFSCSAAKIRRDEGGPPRADEDFTRRPSVVTWFLTSHQQCGVKRPGHGTLMHREDSLAVLQKDPWMKRGDSTKEGGIGFKMLWWRLDHTEGPQRMRRRLELDVLQSSNPSYSLDKESKLYVPIRSAHKRQPSRGAGGFWEHKEVKLEPDAVTAMLKYEGGGADGSSRRQDKDKGGLMSSLVTSLLGPSDAVAEIEANVIDHDKFMWLLQSADDILAIHNCMRLFSGKTVSGVLLVCTHHVYVFDDCQVLSTGEVSMFASAAGQAAAEKAGENGHTNEAEVTAGWEASEMAVVHRWSHSEIRDLQLRKYLLRPVGIEMFTNDGLDDCLLIFHKSERDSVYEQIMTVRQDALAKIEATAPEDKSAPAAQTNLGEAALDLTDASQTSELAQGRWTGRSSRKTLLQNLRKLWLDGDISNLQYLMHLNTLAGRSYNDATQYPVFPWVLRDHKSEHLDLSNPQVFRDLSKPMGAQDEVRGTEFRKRFDNWLEPDPEHPTPPFHYATHYSSAAAVTFYLIRLEPFTSMHLQLQGGKFDHADRIFSSVDECWESASRQSLSDVKELLPEFYYMPELFVNGNRLALGTRQKTSKVVNDVELPPWAHGSADEFVRKMRMALESEYVSAHLHLWIDLVFGCRQRGSAAVEALNVFHHLTYEGNVDVDTITDPVERMSTIAQILNFGQTPTQLFDKPHPRREVGASSALAPQLCTDPSSVETTAVRDLWRLGEGPVRDVRVGQDGKVMVVCGERLLCLPGMQECFTWGNQDGTMRFVALQRPGSSVKKTESEKLLARSVVCYESLHQGFVSVAASSEDGSILVTGSSLGDMSVWRPELRVNASAVGRAAGIQVVRGTEKTVRSLQLRTRLCAHTGAVTCLTVSNTHAVMISGSVDGTVILWDVRRLRFMRQLISNLAAAPVCVDLNLTGSMVVVAAGREIRVVNINGSLLAHVVMDAAQGDRVVSARAIRAPEWAVEYPVIVSGHANGAMRFWRLLPKKLAKAAPTEGGVLGDGSQNREEKLALELIFVCTRTHEAAVTAVSFSADGQQMFTGDSRGTVIMWGKDRKSGNAYSPKWLTAALGPQGRVARVDERLLHCISVQHLRTERCERALGEAGAELITSLAQGEAGAKLITSLDDFAGSTDLYVLRCSLPRPVIFEKAPQDSVGSPPAAMIWETRRTFAQFAELQLLLQRHGGVASATLPPKKPSAFRPGQSEDPEGERERQRGLATFVSACLSQCTVRQAAVLCAFIQAPNALYELSQSLDTHNLAPSGSA